jgi:Leucine-rich repeat (LRR) protein
MMLAVTVFCVWLGAVATRANEQKRGVQAVQASGGWVLYDYECDDRGVRFFRNIPPPPGPAWIRDLVGVDYFADVIQMYAPTADENFIEALGYLTHLNTLFLFGDKVTDATVARIVGLTRLINLELDGASITDTGLTDVAQLPCLRSLCLDRCVRITDAGLEQIGKIRGLEFLNISDCRNVTDSGLRDLGGLTSLQLLNVEGTSVTSGGVEKLKRTLPHLQVVGL